MRDATKIGFFFILFIIMLLTTIWAWSQQDLFTEVNWSGSPMWFQATIVDFYINQLVLWLWVVYLEKKSWVKAMWLVLFICFGSMGTTLYIMQRLFLKKDLFRRV